MNKDCCKGIIMKAGYWILFLFITGMVTIGFAGADIPANATGYLQVSSIPSSAAVYLDAVYQGITPDSKGFINITNLIPREYSLVLKKPDYLDYISTVKIVSGETVKVSANLQAGNVTPPLENPGNPVVTGVVIVIVVLVLVGFLVIYMRSRRKPKEPEKIELD
jgi:hypothetical protein